MFESELTCNLSNSFSIAFSGIKLNIGALQAFLESLILSFSSLLITQQLGSIYVVRGEGCASACKVF